MPPSVSRAYMYRWDNAVCCVVSVSPLGIRSFRRRTIIGTKLSEVVARLGEVNSVRTCI